MSTTITPKQSTQYEVGAILCDTWACEQTNVDFYCIVKISGDWVTVVQMTKITKPYGGPLSMETEETPGTIDTTKRAIRKKLKRYNGEISGFSFRDGITGGWCRLWSGKPKLATHYA